jgi:phospholipase/carboxylesterase
MASLTYEQRAAAGEPSGLLILHHGRGTDELDLLPLADVLDPDRLLHVVSARAPFQLPGSPGFHWYAVPRVGYPDPETFTTSYRALAELHDELWSQTGLDAARTVLGGFSMGTVMSYALGLGSDRPAPAGILAFSGFIPTVDVWKPSFDDRAATRVLVAHGRNDPVIDVEFARLARATLEAAAFEVDYRESEATHAIDPADIPRAASWLERTIE